LLSLGLMWIQQIINAESYEARHQLLGPYPVFSQKYLYAALKYANGSDNEIYLSDYTQEDDKRLALHHPPFVEEHDTGPADAWRWAHQDETRGSFVYSDSQIALRARGYCMWDRGRLDEWNVFQTPWEAPEYPFYGEEQIASQNERSSQMATMRMWRERGPRSMQGGTHR
jgi:hypothetical protein